MAQILKQEITKFVNLTEEQIHDFSDAFTIKNIPKKKYVLQSGEICRFEGFVIKGLFKIYHINDLGKEHIIYFASEGWWLLDAKSFYSQTPSELYMQAIEDSEVLMINKADKEKIIDRIPELNKMYRLVLEHITATLQNRFIVKSGKTAEERYTEFLETFPQLNNRLTNIQIAAYLDIAHETVSKIRNSITKGK